jgi:hypothetical protein
MSFAARLIHTLTSTRTVFDDTAAVQDEYGQPQETTTEIVVPGNVQPKKADEIADTRSAGAEIATHVIFLRPMALSPSDSIEDTEGRVYRITGIRRYEMGRTPHLEVDCYAVDSSGGTTDEDEAEPEGAFSFTTAA